MPAHGTPIRTLIAHETAALVRSAAIPGRADIVTACTPWSVFDILRHVAATASRFVEMHHRALDGDLSAPFDRTHLGDENLRAVAEFSGNPFSSLRELVDQWLTEATDDDQLVGHQFGPQPVSMLNQFLLNDIVIHHLDIEVAGGSTYRPDDDVVEALLPMWNALGVPISTDGDRWASIVRASGRTLVSHSVVLFITHRVLSGRRDDVHSIWQRALLPAIAANPCHEAYSYGFDDDDPDVIRVFQQFRSASAAKDFLTTPAYAAYLAEVELLLVGPPEVSTVTPMWVKGN